MIKEKRLLLGLTQEKISKELNITLRNYIRIESYQVKPNIITALKLCKLLNLNPFDVWNVH